jgi:hypothetical protein
MDVVDEQMDVLAKAFMGQTLGCARCHDHKFDPIPASDYYAMAGIFKSTNSMGSRRGDTPLATEQMLSDKRDFDKKLADARRSLSTFLTEEKEKFQVEWRDDIAAYMIASAELQPDLVPLEVEDFSGGNLRLSEDKKSLNSGLEDIEYFGEWIYNAPAAGEYEVSFRYSSGEALPLRLLINGKVVKADALGESTGVAQRRRGTPALWMTQGRFSLAKGENVLRLEGEKFPSLDQYNIVAVHEVERIDRKTLALAEANGLNPVILTQWARYMNRARDGVHPIFAIWQAFVELNEEHPGTFATEAPVRMAKLYADKESSTFSPSELTWSVISGFPPEDLSDLARRYQTLFETTELAQLAYAKRKEEAEAEAADGEEEEEFTERLDPALAQVRRTLYGAQSPFDISRNIEQKILSGDVVDQLSAMRAKAKAIADAAPAPMAQAMTASDGNIADLPIHIRGSHLTLATTAEPRGFLRATDHVLAPPAVSEGQSGRLDLARWITDPEHPLTARVMVNRIWQGHFGTGIVDSPSNFGLRGSSPTHPKLLDWLARTFIEDGWSIKAMHKRILMSNTYQLSSSYDEANAAIDLGNRYLWRMPRRRLEAEPIRDALLAMGGNLDLTMFGRDPSFNPRGYVFDEGNVIDKQIFYDAPRRSIYMPIVRNAMYNFFSAFDYADASSSVAQRPATVVAPQALLAMNSPFVMKQAELFAQTLLADENQDEASRIQTAFERAYGRPATDEEVREASAFLASMRELDDGDVDNMYDTPEMYAWKKLCHVIVAMSEFIYVS